MDSDTTESGRKRIDVVMADGVTRPLPKVGELFKVVNRQSRGTFITGSIIKLEATGYDPSFTHPRFSIVLGMTNYGGREPSSADRGLPKNIAGNLTYYTWWGNIIPLAGE